jgi:periplasmic mercuric ion binding protein
MKSLRISFLIAILISLSFIGTAQTKSETIKVAGECGMCKGKIEKAAKEAGATYAVWSPETKELNVKYKTAKASSDKIQQAVAAVGYDTQKFKASDAAYEKLHACCHYERGATDANATSCCGAEKCKEAKCAKDGKCTKDASCCKESGCSEKDCCKKD